MGDRCHMSVEVHPEDWERFMRFWPTLRTKGFIGNVLDVLDGVRVLAWEHDTDHEVSDRGTIEFEEEEVNHAAYDEMELAAEHGCRFVARNDDGENYTAGLAVGWGGETHRAYTIEGGVAVIMDDDGSPDDDGLKEAKNTLARMREFYEACAEHAATKKDGTDEDVPNPEGTPD